MSRVKRWIDRAREAAQEHLPDEVVQTGRRIRDSVVEHAPAGVRDVIDHYVGDAPEAAAAPTPGDTDQDDETVVVTVHATDAEADAVASIRATFAEANVPIREVDLTHEPKMARQIARQTGVMVPPYVFIRGRFWGAQYEIESLVAGGDLQKIVDGQLDGISETARRIGGIHDSFSDAMTVENIVDRLRRGHILCVDDLDCWLERDRSGAEHLYYEGAPHPIAELEAIATRIAAEVAAGDVEASWRFEPEVHL